MLGNFKRLIFLCAALTGVGCGSLKMLETKQPSLPEQKAIAPRILVIGHRGACGYRPEHTLASYELAIEMGADFIEPDLVSTKDGVLIVRHENEISETTDVAAKFPNRKKTKKVDGQELTGWFTEDFSLKEIKTLRAKERLKSRDHSFDGIFQVLTFQEVINLVKRKEKEKKRVIGLYAELKHSTYFASIGLPLENRLLKILKRNGYTDENSPIFIQSFEVENLKKLKKTTKVRLLQLLEEPNQQPYDFVVRGDRRTYADMLTPQGLDEVATYATAIGPYKGILITHPMLVADAHKRGLLIHPYTFRSDGPFLAPQYNGDAISEYLKFFDAGVDGVFSDFAADAINARDQYEAKQKNKKGI